MKAFRAAWAVLRIPFAGLLLLLEPIVRWTCGVALVFGVGAAVVQLGTASPQPHALISTLGIGLLAGLALILYYALLSLFTEA